jgi:hypothetical protein
MVLPSATTTRSFDSERFWQRCRKASAFWKAGSLGGVPAVCSASSAICRFERSGRSLES